MYVKRERQFAIHVHKNTKRRVSFGAPRPISSVLPPRKCEKNRENVRNKINSNDIWRTLWWTRSISIQVDVCAQQPAKALYFKTIPTIFSEKRTVFGNPEEMSPPSRLTDVKNRPKTQKFRTPVTRQSLIVICTLLGCICLYQKADFHESSLQISVNELWGDRKMIRT